MRDGSGKQAANEVVGPCGRDGPLASMDALLTWAWVGALVAMRKAPPGSADARWAAGVLGAVLTVLSDMTIAEAASSARRTLKHVSARVEDHEAFAGVRTLPLAAIAAVMNAHAAGWDGRQSDQCAAI